MAPKYRLTYFNSMALAEPIRFVLSYGGAEFEDVRLERADWPEIKPTTPFGKVPMLEVDGKKLHQSAAICRYLAREFGIGGKDSWESMQIDIVVDTIGDFKSQIFTFYSEADPEKKAAKKDAILNETIPHYFSHFEEIIKTNGGFFVDGKMSWADLYWVALLDVFTAALGGDILKDFTGLKAHQDIIRDLPAIKAWLSKRPVTKY